MIRDISILLFVILCATETLCIFDFIKAIIESEDLNITRVRTQEERRQKSNELVVLDFIGLVEQYHGYTAEEYEVLTEDGYYLKLHRISGSPNSPKAPGKPVIYIQHGLFGSSDFHVVLGPEQALTFQLADAGYDIWLGNVRGTSYSKRHVKYSSASSNKNFWDYSIDEIGTIDVPKFIDVVLNKTNQDKLTYIGYSMGTTLSYILLSSKPEYNDKMHLVISMAPVAFYTKPYSTSVKTLLTFFGPAKEIALIGGIYQILPQSKFIQILGKDVCGSKFGKIFCGSILSSVVNVRNINFTALPETLCYVPAGTSLKVLDHYWQMVLSEKFQKYSYGPSSNMLKYHSITPPEYDLSKITSRQVLFYSKDDAYVSVKDVMKLKGMLKNVVDIEKANATGFNHLDFIWAKDARDLIYNRLMQIIAENL